MSGYVKVSVDTARSLANYKIDAINLRRQRFLLDSIHFHMDRRERHRWWFRWLKPLGAAEALRLAESNPFASGGLFKWRDMDSCKAILAMCNESSDQAVYLDSSAVVMLTEMVQ